MFPSGRCSTRQCHGLNTAPSQSGESGASTCCCGMRILASGTHGASLSFHSTVASSIGVRTASTWNCTRRSDRHAAHVLVTIGQRSGVGETDERTVGARTGEDPDPQRLWQVSSDREFGVDAPRRAALVEAANRPVRVALPAGLLEKRDEGGDDRRLPRIDDFPCERGHSIFKNMTTRPCQAVTRSAGGPVSVFHGAKALMTPSSAGLNCG
jgi:hypothetical protein